MAETPWQSSSPGQGLRCLLELAVVGMAVGVVCWPLNLLDRWQDSLLHQLPAFGATWNRTSVALLVAPLAVMPFLILLQTRVWPRGAGSGIPQVMVSLEDPQRTDELMAPVPTVQRLILWSIATLALFPLGREGPVVHLGGALVVALRRWCPGLLGWMGTTERLAVVGSAGLAAGFNTPLVAVLFLAEELIGRFTPRLIWPALVVSSMAALVSALGHQPEFAFGLLSTKAIETDQLLWAVPFGLLAGLSGALMAMLVLLIARRCLPLARRHPLALGLALGAMLSLLGLASGGAGYGDGGTLMASLADGQPTSWSAPLALLARLLGPGLALGMGVPGGLIDPALALGALLGHTLADGLGNGSLAMALGMAASLAGATQLPVVSLMFSLRLMGDQQLLPGVLLASVLGAAVGRLMMKKAIYHELAGQLEAGR
ncbi:MAG: chloride channel protein [Cyanobacteriota bacterium]|nr:chloride channel protein [Cyanobacteriota bacterium]